jgi:hypothetical protein
MGKPSDTSGPIPKEINSKACPFCGGNTYQLVFRTASVTDVSSLLVRCCQCSHPGSLDAEFKSTLWDKI